MIRSWQAIVARKEKEKPNDGTGQDDVGPGRDLQVEWQRLLTIMPASVRAAIPLNLWNRDRMYALDLPVSEISVTDVRWMLDVPLWGVDGGIPFQVTPNQVISDRAKFADQYRRTLAADLAWPIHVMWHNDRWTILDGVHRLLKAEMLGHDTIRAKVLTDEDYASIVHPAG